MKQYDSAILASNSAKRWCLISLCISFLINIIFLIVVALTVGTSILSIIPWLGVLIEFITKMNNFIEFFAGV